MSPRMRWESTELADLVIAYGANPDVLYEYEFEPIRIRKVRNVLRLSGTNENRMFKKVASPDTRLPFVFGVIEHVYRQGFQNVPRFIRNKYGDPFVLDESGQYYMTDWLPGREMDLRKPRHLEAMAEFLGRFHRAAVGYKHAESHFETRDDIRSAWRRGLAKLQTYRQSLMQKDMPGEFDRIFLENYEFLKELMEDALLQLRVSPYTELVAQARECQQICHGSVSRQNILVDEDRLYFVDFDHCHYGPVVQDLASFLHRYMPRCEWDEDVVIAVVDAYQQGRPLTREELHLLLVYLQFPVHSMQRLEWYYEHIRNWDEKTFEESLLKALDAEEDRDDLIDILAEYYGIDLDGETPRPVALRQDQTNRMQPSYVQANATQPESTVQAEIHDGQSSAIPVRWTSESSSMGLIDDEEDDPVTKARRTNSTRKIKQRPKAESVRTDAAEDSNGIWIDPKHIRRPASSPPNPEDR
jgi:CotS family spore coat protein